MHRSPGASGVSGADVAAALSPEPADTPTVLPSGSADAEQALGLGRGPHSVKLTFPVGGPPVALPVTVAVTVLLLSSGTLELAGAAVMPGVKVPPGSDSCPKPFPRRRWARCRSRAGPWS